MAISGRGYSNRPVIVTGHIGGQDVVLTAIASEEAFGTAQLIIDQAIAPSAIASTEAFGTAQLNFTIIGSGISSAEAFGNTTLGLFVGPTAIASEEAFGSPTIPAEWILRPPTVQETPMALNILHMRYGIHRGISIVKRSNGTYYSTRYPAQTEIEESLATYLGGYKYTISETVKNELVAAGFGSYVTQEPT